VIEKPYLMSAPKTRIAQLNVTFAPWAISGDVQFSRELN